MLDDGLAGRLAAQLEALGFALGASDEPTLRRRPPSGKWSAHENLAHLGRYHELFLDRLERILAEDLPALPRYRAEEDAGWPEWVALPTAEASRRLRLLRQRLLERLRGLSDEQLGRRGIHPAFGEMTVPMWVEFFLLHEAHHLYVMLARARGA